MKPIVFALTLVLTVFYGTWLKNMLVAGHYWVAPVCLIATFALIYLMSNDEDRADMRGWPRAVRNFLLRRQS